MDGMGFSWDPIGLNLHLFMLAKRPLGRFFWGQFLEAVSCLLILLIPQLEMKDDESI